MRLKLQKNQIFLEIKDKIYTTKIHTVAHKHGTNTVADDTTAVAL